MTKQTSNLCLISWSGGKDCSLACYYAIERGMEVRYLLSAIDHTGRVGAHAIQPSLLEMQSKAIGIPLVKLPVTVETYDEDFRRQLNIFKSKGIEAAIFGDVNLGNGEAKLHRSWIESVCLPVGMTPYIPLWTLDRETVLRNVVDLGFDIRFVVVDNANFGPDWIGQRIDHSVINELKNRAQRSPHGRVGYYHTVVLDGPIFKWGLAVTESKPIHRVDEWGDNWYWEILDCIPRSVDRCLVQTNREEVISR